MPEKRKPKTLSKNGKPIGRPITRTPKKTLAESVGMKNEDLAQFISKKSAPAENQEEKNQLVMKKASIGNITSLKNCDPIIVSQFLKESYMLSKQPMVKSDEECIQRLDWYFETCFSEHRIPCVEDMALALGIIRTTLNEWERGSLGSRRMDIIKKAKVLLSSIDAKLVASGELNPVTYIFRSKNYYGMVDKTEIEHQVGDPYGEKAQTQEELQAKYQKSLPED